MYYAKACFHTDTYVSDDLIEANDNNEVIQIGDAAEQMKHILMLRTELEASCTYETYTLSEISDETDFTCETNVEYEVEATSPKNVSVATFCTDKANPCIEVDFNDDHVIKDIDSANVEMDSANRAKITASVDA